MSELTFDLQSVKYKGKVYKRCTLKLEEERKEAKILVTKNHIIPSDRQVLFLNKQVPLLSITYDASTTVELRGRSLLLNNDILIEMPEPREASKISELLSRPRKEAEGKSREALFKAEKAIRSFLETREVALGFLSSLRINPRRTMLDLSSVLEEKQIGDPVDEMTKLCSERLTEHSDELSTVLSEVEVVAGKDQANRLYAVTYFIGKLQDAYFEGKDPKRLEVLKSFGLELGFNDTLFEGLAKKTPNDGLLDLFRNTRLIDVFQPLTA